jgi:hypothetical protein
MNTRTRLITPVLIAATVAGAVGIASAATTPTLRAHGCVTPKLVGMSEQAARRTARAAGCIVTLHGGPLQQATIQTIAGQTPAPGVRSVTVRLTLNPLCFGSALSGPPPDQGMRPGPTELITGLYLVGGPAIAYSSPHCRRPPGKPESPAPGTIDVLDPGGGSVVASRTATRGRRVRFQLAPARYRVTASAQHEARLVGRPFTIKAGYTTRRYLIEPVP